VTPTKAGILREIFRRRHQAHELTTYEYCQHLDHIRRQTVSRLEQLLIKHEGKRNKVYHDSKGIASIGIGRNLEDPGLSDSECLYLLENDINMRVHRLMQFKWFQDLDDVRQDAIIDMAFMGVDKLLGFHDMIACLAAKDWEGAVREEKDSKWAREDVQQERVDDVAHLLLTGEYPNV